MCSSKTDRRGTGTWFSHEITHFSGCHSVVWLSWRFTVSHLFAIILYSSESHFFAITFYWLWWSRPSATFKIPEYTGDKYEHYDYHNPYYNPNCRSSGTWKIKVTIFTLVSKPAGENDMQEVSTQKTRKADVGTGAVLVYRYTGEFLLFSYSYMELWRSSLMFRSFVYRYTRTQPQNCLLPVFLLTVVDLSCLVS